MIVNINGSLTSSSQTILSYSDSLLNTTALIEEQILFNGFECETFEAHYFSIMASMRIFRRSIPMGYTPEFLLDEIRKTIEGNKLHQEILVYFYSGIDFSGTPIFYIRVRPLDTDHFRIQSIDTIDVFKDFYWHSDYLSGIRVKPLPVQVVAQAYCADHAYSDCILINERKEIVMSLNGFIFLRFGQTIKTPAESSGVYREVLRGRIIELIKGIESFDFEETSLNPFDIQRADEFLVISPDRGLFAVSNYRKTTYKNEVQNLVQRKLKDLI